MSKYRKHKTSCLAYSNYQPPYEECNCGADDNTNNSAARSTLLDRLRAIRLPSDAELHDLIAEAVEVLSEQTDRIHELEAELAVGARPLVLVEPGDVTVARKEVFGDWTSGVAGPTHEDHRVSDVLNRRLKDRTPLAAGDRPSLQIDELFQELELALWGKIGNTWEATQGQRVEAFLRKYLRAVGDRPSLDPLSAALHTVAQLGIAPLDLDCLAPDEDAALRAPLDVVREAVDKARLERLAERMQALVEVRRAIPVSSPAPASPHAETCSCPACRQHVFTPDQRGDCRYCGEGPSGCEHPTFPGVLSHKR